MSIYAYTGLPGSGKSYSVVEHQVIPALKAGRRVVTNVALKFDQVRQAFPMGDLVELPTQRIQGDPAAIYEYVTPGSVLVLDEVWRLFPAGLKANHVPEPFRKLLAEHRHMVNDQGESCQIVLVTQDLAQISAFARQLVETTFRTVKLTTVGLQKQYRVDVFNGPATGPNPPESARIRQIFGTFSSDVWQHYQSHTMRADTGQVAKVNEKAVDRRANILARPVMVLGAIAAVAFIVYGVMSLDSLLERKGATSAARDAEPSQAAAVANHPPMPVTRSDEKPLVPVLADQVARATAAQLVGIIENLDAPERSIALLRVEKRVLSRPLSYCKLDGWWQCDFPDFGKVSM